MKHLRRAQRFLGPIVVLVAAVFLILALIRGWGDVREFEWRFDPFYLILSVVLLFAYYAQQWGGWRLIMRSYGDPLDRTESAAIWFASILGRYVPGNVAMVAGRIGLCSRRGIPGATTFASMVYENALILLSALVVAAASVPFWPPFEYRGYALLLLLLVPFGLVMLHPKVFRTISGFGLRRLGQPPLSRTLSPPQIVTLLLYYVGGWLLIGLAFACLAASIAPVEVAYLAVLIGGYAFAWEVGFLSFLTPGGLGVKEGILVLVLSLVLPAPVAVALAVLSRLWQTLAELAIAAVVWAFFKGRVALAK